MDESRRNFIRNSAIGVAGAVGSLYFGHMAAAIPVTPPDLYMLSSQLLEEWAAKLLSLQVKDRSDTEHFGGILCPAKGLVQGRMGDAIYPFCFLADKKGDQRYADSAVLMYRWMERHVSQSDGSWLNEPVKGSWKGTTVFSAIALAETLKYHASVLDDGFYKEVELRLKRAGDFIYANFNMEYGNINYPVNAAYGLSLLGVLLDDGRFRQRGRELAHQSLKAITVNDKLISGEGGLYNQRSKRGCFFVDLGYNVEESLPALVLYGLLAKDEEVLHAVEASMAAHLEFMLPDGAWDNSWGTRNYKWTYWGSRTSDGCQPAYALMAHRNPLFYKAAIQNTMLLKECTADGLLQGGPHNYRHHIIPSVHHTFCHIKALATILDHHTDLQTISTEKIKLPREKEYGLRFFPDIRTWLIAKGQYRATVTAFDAEYKKFRNGHASGGALSMLWHERWGAVVAAGMNKYQLYEADNMQADTDPQSICITPRVELQTGGELYMNISFLDAVVDVKEENGQITADANSMLVDGNQQHPPAGEIKCSVTYIVTHTSVTLKFKAEPGKHNDGIRIIVPVISSSSYKLTVLSGKAISVKKEKCTLNVIADANMDQLNIQDNKRLFSFVPGFEFIPLCFSTPELTVEISIT